jgi:nicotinate-nucleotide adenylyltransferase
VTRCVALLGGSFDPVHHGHVAMAELFADLLKPDELRIVPAKPWQKSALQASDAQRVAMLELAFRHARCPAVLDLQEIERDAPTFTVDTLRKVRAELGPQASIAFLMGADQLRQLDTWRDWRSLFELAHIAVAARPGVDLAQAALPPALALELERRLTPPERLCATPSGLVTIAHSFAVDVSATGVRDALRAGADAGALVAPQVLDYIQQHNLYKS